MPFRSLYREQMTAAEYQTPGALCIVHPEYEEQDRSNQRYHEMDYYPQVQQNTAPRVPKYSTGMEMDDELSYLRQSRLDYLAGAASTATSAELTASFAYSHLIDMEEHESSVPSLRTNSMAGSSASEPSLHAVGTSGDDRVCPLISGETRSCHPDRCGPEAPCMNFTRISTIEGSTEVSSLGTVRPTQSSKLKQSSADLSPSRPQVSRKSPSESHTPKSSSKADAKRRAKQAHSLVEKKYRENLNTKLCQLHDTLRSSRYGPKKTRDCEDEDSDEFANSALNGAKFRKGDVLDDALDYVNQTEVEMRHMEHEIQRLLGIVGILEGRINFDAGCSGQGVLSMPMQLRPG